MAKPLWALDATETARLIRKKQTSATEVVEAHLARLDAMNPKLNAVVRALHDDARAEAAAADEAIEYGDKLGPLHGVPITTKINVDQTGLPTDNGVKMLKDLIAKEDSPQVANLRAAGAIVIGRTNSPAFAMRATTDNALHGLTRNPWNEDVTCGGSSGGAGASLAVGIGALAQGNDIGGSIRWPAYCNGVIGLRPSIGRVPAHNPSAAAPRAFAAQIMSVNGPMARSMRDIRLGLAVMSEGDPRDPMWVPAPLNPPPFNAPVGVAVAIHDSLHPEIKATLRRAASHLQDAGYDVEEISPPDLERVADLWSDIGLAEIGPLLRPLIATIGDEGMTRFMEDLWALKGSADLAKYQAALRAREVLLIKWQIFLDTHPLILMPSCGELSIPVGLDTQGPEAVNRLLEAIRYQFAIPVLGLPSLAVPMGTHDGLPMGIQIVSRRFREDLCIAAGELIEAREPPVCPIDVKW
ncbi:MAG: amidase [Alphaproteobacteria bacterium]|nr:amidase [Alphaproteobacteria bacterium]